MLEGRPGWYRCTDTESGVEMDFDADDPNGRQDVRVPERYGADVTAVARLMREMGDFLSGWLTEQKKFVEGCLLAEIQQASDVTYRIYDFNRRDKDGNLRELHTEKAAECIDYTVLNDYRTEFTAEKNRGVQIVSCPFFNTAVYDLDEPMTLDYSELDSFVVLIGLKGEARLTDNEGNTTTLRGGETLLVPASTATIKVDGNIKFLETYA